MSKRSKISIVLSSMLLLGQLSTPLTSLAAVNQNLVSIVGAQNFNNILFQKGDLYNCGNSASCSNDTDAGNLIKSMAAEAVHLSPYARLAEEYCEDENKTKNAAVRENNSQYIAVRERFEKIFGENELLRNFCLDVLGVGSGNNSGKVAEYSLNSHPEIYDVTQKIKPVLTKSSNLPSVASALKKAADGFAANDAYFLAKQEGPLAPDQTYGSMCCWDSSHAALNEYIEYISKRGNEGMDEGVMAGYAGTPLSVDFTGYLPHAFTYIYFSRADMLIFVDPLLDIKFFVPLFLCANDKEKSDVMKETCKMLDARLEKASEAVSKRVSNWFFNFLRIVFKNFLAIARSLKTIGISLFYWILGTKYLNDETPEVRISQSIMVNGRLDPVWLNNNFGELYWTSSASFPTLAKNGDLNNRSAFSKSWIIR